MSEHKLSGWILRGNAALVTRWPGRVVAAFAILLAASLFVTATRLEFKMDQNDLVSADLPYNRRYLDFIKDFGDLEFLYVVIAVDGKPERAIEVAEAVSAEMSGLREHVKDVLHRIHPKSFGDGVLLLGTVEELTELVESVKGNESLVKDLGRVDSFAGLLRYVAKSIDPSMAQKDREAAEWGFRFLEMILATLRSAAEGEIVPPLEDAIERIVLGPGRPPLDRGYLATGNLLLVEIMPAKDFATLEIIREPLAKIREGLDRVRARFPDVDFGLTGRPVLQADEMSTTNDDMARAAVLALVLVFGLFTLFFRRLRRPSLAMVSLIVGLCLTFGLATITIGYLTLLSVVFAAILIGLGIDFGVHFLARYQEEVRRQDTVEGAAATTLVSTGLGIWTGGITTSAAFFSTCLVHFRGLRELGFVAGSGLVLCMVTMLTLLPALILLKDRGIRKRRVLVPPQLVRVPGVGSLIRRPAVTVGALGILSIAGLPYVVGFLGSPRWYNGNLLDLQVRGLESVEYELKFIEESDRSTWDSVFIVESIEAVDRILAALDPATAAGVVGAVESVRDYVGRDQEAKARLLEPMERILSEIRIPTPASGVDSQDLSEAMAGLLDRFDRLQSMMATRGLPEDLEGVMAVDGLIGCLEALAERLEEDAETCLANLSALQIRWFGELRVVFEKFQRMARPPAITVASLPPAIRRRCVSEDGTRFLVHAYPMKDIWQGANMEEFVSAVRAVDPDVTGVPIQVYESERLMREGFKRSAWYSLLAVFILLFVDFRNLRFALLAMVPLGVGLLWTLEVMALASLSFNLANFFALPILVGYGVAGGIHVIHRYREFHSSADLAGTVSSAVSLSFLTTIAGFGSLITAKHRGIVSLGLVTSLGCLLILVASVILLPSLIALVAPRDGKEGRAGKAG